MAARETTLTAKGQITIPAEIRARLGLKARDRMEIEVEGDTVRLRRAGSRIERHFGTAGIPGKVLDWKDERKAFEEGVAEEASSEGA